MKEEGRNQAVPEELEAAVSRWRRRVPGTDGKHSQTKRNLGKGGAHVPANLPTSSMKRPAEAACCLSFYIFSSCSLFSISLFSPCLKVDFKPIL